MQPLQRRSIRLPGYDYTQPGRYFITVVTKQRECHFGEISGCAMQENMLGKMVRREWLLLAQRFPNSEIDEFIVMPDHFHGILALIDEPQGATSPTQEAFGRPVHGSIPTIVRSFKAATTLRARRMLGDSLTQLWQRNYFEHVIQDEHELEAARLYIRENPIHWAEDHENPARGK